MRDSVYIFFIGILKRLYPLCQIRRAKQAAPVTYDNTIVLDLMSERSLGEDVYFDYCEGSLVVEGIVEATLNIQCIGEGAVEKLAMLKFYLELPTMVDLFRAANIAVNEFDAVQDLTAAIDGRDWQTRASVDLTISFSRTLDIDADWFNKVYIEGKIDDGVEETPPKKETDAYVSVILKNRS